MSSPTETKPEFYQYCIEYRSAEGFKKKNFKVVIFFLVLLILKKNISEAYTPKFVLNFF